MSRTRKGGKRKARILGPLPKYIIPLEVRRPFRRETKRLCRILKSVKNADGWDFHFPKYQPAAVWDSWL